MSIFVLGIDLGKNVCSLVGLDEAGAVVLRRRIRRDGVVDFVSRLPACTVAMEACCGAHHLGRVLGAAGYTIRLMSPEYVRPYVKANKNDDHDAEAIAEAATRPTMRFVPVKSEAQSDIQSLHRARSRLVAERTALINHLRALLLERGIVVAQGRHKLEAALSVSADEGEPRLSQRMRVLVDDLRAEWRSLDERSPPSTRSSCIWRARMKRRAGFQRYLGSASSTRPRLLLRSATRGASGVAVTLPPGWG